MNFSPLDSINKSLRQTNSELTRITSDISDRRNEQIQREIENNQSLKEIADNTRVLKSIFEILQENTDKQDEIILLLTELLSIGRATTVEEADTLYRKVFIKISSFTGDFETIQKLQSIAAAFVKIIKLGLTGDSSE